VVADALPVAGASGWQRRGMATRKRRLPGMPRQRWLHRLTPRTSPGQRGTYIVKQLKAFKPATARTAQ